MTALQRVAALLTGAPLPRPADALVADIRASTEAARREAEMFRRAVADDAPIRAWCRMTGVECG